MAMLMLYPAYINNNVPIKLSSQTVYPDHTFFVNLPNELKNVKHIFLETPENSSFPKNGILRLKQQVFDSIEFPQCSFCA